MTDSTGYDIFVLGLDEANLGTLREVSAFAECRFHPLLSREELLEGGSLRIQDLLMKAEEQLREFDGTVDAVVGYWDFPVSSMVPILCSRLGLRGAGLAAVLKCEHKYWSRCEQQKVIDEHPRFGLVRLDDDAPPENLNYPMWLKPVKAFSSELAFRIDNDDEFHSALTEIRAGIGRVGEPFQYILDQVELPAEIADAGGEVCLAEEAAHGKQVTVEGFYGDDGVHVYGVIDSHNYDGAPSFERYQYPSVLPDDVQERMAEISAKVITQIGLTAVAFNIEYFWDEDTGAINLLEINPRHSQSHAKLFDYVDGLPNHQCMVQLALGQQPDLPFRKGPHQVAAKWFVRRFTDGVVRTAPTEEELAEIEKAVGGCEITLLAHDGDRLSALPEQDSYSYAIATVHVGADDEAQLKSRYEDVVRRLPFEFEDE